jgi:cold-inducible RNA-binding protein
MNIFVAKLNFDTSSDGLREAFEVFGEVESAKVIMDHFTGKSKGFGFVEMPNDDEAYNAIEQLNESDLDGNTIVVKKAEPRKPKTGGYDRGGGGGGYSRGGGGGYDRGGGGGGYGDRRGGGGGGYGDRRGGGGGGYGDRRGGGGGGYGDRRGGGGGGYGDRRGGGGGYDRGGGGGYERRERDDNDDKYNRWE